MHNTLLLINIILMMTSALMAMAFYTLSERKFLGYMQYRKGPNKPSITALAIPMSDAIKLFSKEQKPMFMMNTKHFNIASIMMMVLALLLWPLYPHSFSLFFLKFGIIYFLCVTSVSIYTTFMVGWSSNSKWGLLGALRGIAQMISYEVTMALTLICFIMYPMSSNMLSMMQNSYSWVIMLTIPLSLMWLTSILAETHRTPFDFAEGESELVSGFNIEYSNSLFAMIFMAEYMNIIFMSMISVLVLTSSYSNMELVMKSTILSFMFIWTRGALPRLRYDLLMNMLWKKFLPVSLFMIMFIMPMVTTIKWYCAG